MSNLLDGFTDFSPHVTIPSRDGGMVPFSPLLPSQEYLLGEFQRGLADGIHDFLVLKGGRQSTVGGSTLLDAITIYLLQKHSGLVGLMVSDEDSNRDYRRDLMLTMLDSLPKRLRQPVRRDNARMLAWQDNPSTGYQGSRLLFAAAGKREDRNVGRSKGINFNYNDEFGFWLQQKVYSALRASRSEVHPLRFYVDISTANGVNSLMHNEWKIAERATTRRAIFVSCWRNQFVSTRVERTDPRWERYGGDLTRDEKAAAREVKRRYGVTLTMEFFVWYRWKCAEDFAGDETLMAQEYGLLPEECFQAFGDKFISPGVIRKMRAALPRAPKPTGYVYDWAEHFDEIDLRRTPVEEADLIIYHEPDPTAMYVLAAHPWGSSSQAATAFCCQVWRAWPDRLRLDAEFYAADCLMFRFAWVCVHLAAAYRNFAKESKVYFNLEIGWTGAKVLEELRRMESLSWGFSGAGKSADFADVFGCIHYLFRRVDSFSQQVLPHTKSTPEVRLRNLYGLRDAVERRQLEIPHPPLIDELAALRRGEEGDADQVGGGGGASEVRALVAAMTVDAWLQNAIEDLALLVAPKSEEENGTGTVLEANVKSFLGRVYKG